MSKQLRYTMFYDVFFPSDSESGTSDRADGVLTLSRLLRYRPKPDMDPRKASLVVFDVETTGLHPEEDRIIEIGALKIQNGVPIDEFEMLVKVPLTLTEETTKLTGITADMLRDAAEISGVMPGFLEFIKGSILVAHNAEFDMSFLRHECERLDYEIDLACFCSLKLSRALLHDIQHKNLDALAAYYGLTFEARHRALGDCKVTYAVLERLLAAEGGHLKTWQDFAPYSVTPYK